MPTDIGFNDTTIINSDDKATLLAMFDKLTRIAEGRRIQPHDQMNNVTYAHRTAFSTYGLQIGDSCFMIPPEFICVTSESTSQPIVTLRQENSMRQKAGSRKRTLLIDLVFNGFNQINGYRVEGPESPGKDYYMDGLRQMLAQFKCTPFLPIQNEFINGTHGIFTVVLQGITISTVPGFPSLMTAQLTLQEVEMFPYLEMPNAAFKSMIDWDLFRYYYQRFLTEDHEYKKLQSLPPDKDYNHFKLSILKESVFTEMDETEVKYGNKNDELLRQICDNDSYDVWVDSSIHDVKIGAFQCGYYNILTNLQLNDTATPTVQFMGGMDTMFNISLETTDVEVVTAIEQCRIYNDAMVRNNAKYRSLGFVKLESELVSFTGSLFVTIDSVITSTTPEFPGLYQIQMQCTAFDIGQSARENLNGFTPFDDSISKQIYGIEHQDSCARLTEDGYVSDHVHEEQVIEQSMDGLHVKIRQDCYAEWKLRSTMELYPDLFLPKYAEVDVFIAKCNAFRQGKGLVPLPYTKYPTRPECMLQGLPLTNNVQLSGKIILAKDIPRNSEYEGFVDPDFYVFYPNSYQSFGLEAYDMYDPSTRSEISKDITINTKPFGDDPVNEGSARASGMANGDLIDRFIAKARAQVGKQYKQNDIPNAFVCTTLVWWSLVQVGAFPSDDVLEESSSMRVTYMLQNADGLDGKSQRYKRVPHEEMRRGDLIIQYKPPASKKIENCQHVMIFDGNGINDQNARVIHAANSTRGVVDDKFWWPPTAQYDVLRILALDSPLGEAAPTATPGSLEERQNIIWGIAKSMGYNDYAAAGIVGCWTAESGCNPRKIEGDYLNSLKYLPTFNESGGFDMIYNRSQMNAWTKTLFAVYKSEGKKIDESAYYDNSGENLYPGIGLAQWTGPRGEAFLQFAGSAWDTLEKQTEFTIMELQTTRTTADNKLRNATDAMQAAADFCYYFEGYKGDSTGRQKVAQEVYDRLKGTGGTPYTPGASSVDLTPLKDKNVLTRAEVNAICQTVYGQVEGMKDYLTEALGLTQLIYDLMTCSQTTNGLGTILNNKEFFPEPKATDFPADIESMVESVFCEGVRRWPDSTLAAYLPANGKISSFAVFQQMYDKVNDDGQLIFWEKAPKKPSSDKKFTIVESQLTGMASRANYDVITSITYPVKQAELDKFAEPVFVETDAILYSDKPFEGWFDGKSNMAKRKAAKEELNDGENIFGSSFVDEAQYSCRGRLVRAFPTYMFCILDDDTQWYMGNKLWTNYYMRKSVVDIQVHETNDMPIATAVLTVANVYGTLSTKQKGLSGYDVKNDLTGVTKWWYKATGQILDFGSPNLTESAIKLKQVIYDNARLREGSRAHIRMGYGSDPMSLAPMMNGTITEVSVGDQLTIVVSSDGVELTQHITSSTEKTNNGWLGLFGLGEDQESSNLIANLLCKRDSIMNYFVSAWFEGSKYGIEHFGLYFNQSAVAVVHGVATGVLTGVAIGAATGAVAGPVGALIGAGVGALVGVFASSDISIKDLWDGYAEQYDICKNLYKADYTREHYIYANFAEIDGEKNICFNEANMTPWDVMQIATQQVPEYIVKPSYHQFDSRLYFGLPFWMEKYRYDYLGGRVYEECKASTQVHMVESVTNIIDNQVKVTNKYNDTNKKVIYVLGDSPASTRVIHSDDTIDYAKQKTGIIDSAVTQDCLGPDALYEFLGYEIGQESARRIGISNLLYEWQLQYQGEIICTGLPGVKAHDFVLVNDTYVTMMGIAIVREVTHSFSTNTGFTTSITPGMMGFSSDQQSGLIVAAQNYLQIFNGFSSFLMARNMMKVNYEKNLRILSAISVLEQKEKYLLFNNAIADLSLRATSTALSVASSAVTIIGIAKVGKEAYTFCKACISTKKIAQLGSIATAAVNAFKASWATYKGVTSTLKIAQGIGQISRLFSAINAGITAGLTTIFPPAAIAWMIALFIIERILHEVFAWIENRNVCVLLPLWYDTSPFISGVQGQRKLLLFDSNNAALFGRDDETSANDNEHRDDGMWDEDAYYD